jgi:hypothetical protein
MIGLSELFACIFRVLGRILKKLDTLHFMLHERCSVRAHSPGLF